MADCRGQSFAQRGQASCDYVTAQCGYGVCKDSLGDHCYGINPSLGYQAGQYEPLGNSTCLQPGSYCPTAFDRYYTPGTISTYVCCSQAGWLMSCPNNSCACYELSQLASLEPYVPQSSIATRSSSSIAQTLTPSQSSAATTSASPSSGNPTSTGDLTTSQESGRADSAGSKAGTIAGIVIGAVAGAALLLGLALWLHRRRRTAAGKAVELAHDEKNELESSSVKPSTSVERSNMHELDSSLGLNCEGNAQETSRSQELDGRQIPVEAGSST
ncbi:hypothetical protein DE146DRAFT_627245 [Phaeosphaeria sp. MPI-PUGE-AT-0046c]|nr:hypothetical protein DE146DRAFT_627245 [Phaeosphaeria sp. MPI-PUGE-AT-0046c]